MLLPSALLQSGVPEMLFLGMGALMLFIFVVGWGLAILPIIAVVHVIIRDDMADVQKLVWALLVFFIPFVWLVYFLLGKERTAEIFADV